MKESIKEVLDAGLEVSNTEVGYMRLVNDEEGKYLFQTSYRSSHYGSFESMVDQFLQESNLEDLRDNIY